MSTAPVRPPVNEVVISASFEPQAVLDGPRLMMSLSEIYREFPSVTEMPPYEMAMELPTDERIFRPSSPQIKFVNPAELQRRLWFTKAEDPVLLVQAQSNYLALNWRRQGETTRYPGFEELLRRFLNYLTAVDNTCIKNGGRRLEISQIEITYINILRPDGVWGSFRDVPQVVAVQSPNMADIDHFNLSYSKAIGDPQTGAFQGRLHVAVATGYQPKIAAEDVLHPTSVHDMLPVLNVSITARSGKLAEETDTIRPRFERSHLIVEREFKQVTTDAARANWGLS